MSLIKFNFQFSKRSYYLWLIFTLSIDFILLSLYFTIFHFNKYIHFGSDPISSSNTSIAKYLDLTKCLGIISINRNSQIFVDGNYFDIRMFRNHAQNWSINHKSFVIIYCNNNSNLYDLFKIMDILSEFDIPKVYISNSN